MAAFWIASMFTTNANFESFARLSAASIAIRISRKESS